MARKRKPTGIFASFMHFAAYIATGAMAIAIIGVFITSAGVNSTKTSFFNRASETNMSPIFRWGNAADFDGATGFIDVTNGILELPNLTNDFTIESYFKIDSCATNPYAESGIIARGPSQTSSINYAGAVGDSSGQCTNLAFQFVGNTIGPNIVSTTQFVPQTWYHFALTKTSSQLKLFINGILENTVNISPNFQFTNFGQHLLIGASVGSYNYTDPEAKLDGQMDELRISSLVRYTSNFTVPFSPFIPDASTVALYHFDEQNGSSQVVDATKHGHTGLVHGNVQFVQSTVPSPFAGSSK